MGGVYGNSTDGYGVWGNSVNNHAVFGQSADGRGVKGVSPAGGVYGESTQGIGVEGKSNTNDGIVGVTLAGDKSGVYGSSDVGNGVTGRSAGASGVLGVTTSSDPSDAGLHARNEGSGPAVYSEGALYVTGKHYGNVGPNEGAPFPRPAFNSGWVPVSGNYVSFTLGVDQFLPTSHYNNENFFIEMMTKNTLHYAGNTHVGDVADYTIKNNNSILVSIGDNTYVIGDDEFDRVTAVRIRIWYIR
jgi:hypothetical protein